MTLFKYDIKELRFVRIKYWRGRIIGIVLLALCLFIFAIFFNTMKSIEYEREIIVILAEHDKFSEEKFIKMLKIMNFKFPHIVHAQAVLESNNFSSKLFIENNNMFGMRNALVRVNISQGEKNGYAYYKSWIDSVHDYGYYYATYLWKIDSEDLYFSYLSESYAEDPKYVGKLRVIIENNKSKFK